MADTVDITRVYSPVSFWFNQGYLNELVLLSTAYIISLIVVVIICDIVNIISAFNKKLFLMGCLVEKINWLIDNKFYLLIFYKIFPRQQRVADVSSAELTFSVRRV